MPSAGGSLTAGRRYGSRLVIQGPEGAERVLALGSDPVSLGRSESNDVVVPERTVSREHARIVYDRGAYWIEDLGSANGTFVNGERVSRHALRPDDTIRLGQASGHALVFHQRLDFTEVFESAPAIPVEPTRENVRSLSALLQIAKALNSTLAVDELLDRIMDAVIVLTRAERGLLLLGRTGEELERRVERGGAGEPEGVVRYSRSVVAQVLATGEPCILTDVLDSTRFSHVDSIMAMGLRSVMCVPLRPGFGELGVPRIGEPASGGTPGHRGPGAPVLGVIYVDRRAPLKTFDEDDLSLFEAFAGQAAIAIRNAQLYEGLRDSKEALARAYDATLEGWARALELRDKETEGHTRRVVELTVRLGRRLGLSHEELVHARRGALLHDIGKMAVPDRILHKAGPLDEEELRIMEQHPVHAVQMLSPIDYLRKALDIPYCHHERWDGSGYPRGLKGEEIPLAARIFAVVDAWDALTSDRPYRDAWPPERVRQHLRSLAGSHFDPAVVEAFLALELE